MYNHSDHVIVRTFCHSERSEESISQIPALSRASLRGAQLRLENPNYVIASNSRPPSFTAPHLFFPRCPARALRDRPQPGNEKSFRHFEWIFAAFCAGKKRRKNLSFRLSSPAAEGLTLLRAPIRGFVNKPAPALTLLVPPPLTAQTSGRILFKIKEMVISEEHSDEESI